jgi:outer membrane protein OmpA-like peptidoglycan-associated protein
MEASLTRAGLRAAGVVLALLTGGCATEDYVNKQVAPVAAEASEAKAQAAQAQGTAAEALDRANSAHKLAQGKFLYEEVLSDDAVKFPTDSDKLSPEAQSRLDQLVQKLKSENKNVYLEIQGFTDASGDSKYNHKLGQARAEAVQRYLHKGGVALNRMAIISYGEEDPIARNDTPQGRAQNRRVTIVVLI